jgi:hypothetical protein
LAWNKIWVKSEMSSIRFVLWKLPTQVNSVHFNWIPKRKRTDYVSLRILFYLRLKYFIWFYCIFSLLLSFFWAETDVSISNINFVSVAIAVHFFLFINFVSPLSTFIYCSTSAIDAHKGARKVITYKVDTPSTILGLDKEIFRLKN